MSFILCVFGDKLIKCMKVKEALVLFRQPLYLMPNGALGIKKFYSV